MTLTPLAPDLWHAEDQLRMPGGLAFPIRMVVARLPDGTLWLHSPIPVDDDLAASIDALGPVGVIVAPNAMHSLYLADAAARWPDARVWGAPKLADTKPDLPIVHRLEGTPPWHDTLRPLHIDGAPIVDEHVFLHVPSGTLICTDLIFHMQQVANWRTKALLWIVGAWRRATASRSWILFTRDKGAVSASLQRLLVLPVTRVVMAHGAVIEDDAQQRLADAVGWLVRRGGGRLPG